LRRRSLAEIAVVFGVAACIAAAPPAKKAPRGMKTREFKDQKISFTTPEAWEEAGQGCHGAFCVLTLPSPPTPPVRVRPGQKEPAPQVHLGSMFVAVVDRPGVDGSDLDKALESLQKTISDECKDAKFTPAPDTTVGGSPAKAVIATMSVDIGGGQKPLACKEMHIVTVHNAKPCELVVQASPANFERVKNLLSPVVKSVTWLDETKDSSASAR
jgi:hypothetical protein